jgi:hypothetical protein
MRRLLLSLTLALMLSAVGASSALAEAPEGAQTVPLYGPKAEFEACAIGAAPTPNTFGFVVLNTPGNEMTLSGEVALKGAKPNTEFAVDVTEAIPPSFCVFKHLGTITTNTNGNGNLHFTDERSPGSTKFLVEIFKHANEEDFANSSVELD